jgi:hypothetical protein
MKIDELQCIIKKHGNDLLNKSYYCIGGYKLLEHIEDVPGFVSLLRDFYRRTGSLMDDHPDIIEFILNNTIFFGADDGWTNAADDYHTYFYRGDQ